MGDQENNYADVIETLFNTFSGVIEKEVIAAVVESYEGDLNQSANALMSISGDLNPGNFMQPPGLENNLGQPPNFIPTTYNNVQDNAQLAMSYAHASQQSPPVAVNQNPAPPQSTQKKVISNTYWTDQIREIIASYNKGWRVLILMRGAPGCGKSFLSREILQMTVGLVKNYQTHIMSTDDYFYSRGVYKHDKSKLAEAHMWNQRRAQKAMEQGVSPIIIDNTNIEVWEMDPYVKAAVNNGYIVNVVEPHTPWAKKANQLYKKNVHNVPFQTIQRMLDNYQEGISGETLVCYSGKSYPANLTPPVLRNFPPIPEEVVNIPDQRSSVKPCIKIEKEKKEIKKVVPPLVSEVQAPLVADDNKIEKILSPNNITLTPEQPAMEEKEINNAVEDNAMQNESNEDDKKVEENVVDYTEVAKRIELFQQVEEAWDNGENWEDNAQQATTAASRLTQSIMLSSSKPQRNRESIPKTSLISLDATEDWSKLTVFPTASSSAAGISEANKRIIEKMSTSTCFELGDNDISDLKNPFKIITATPRDINMFIAPRVEKIPEQRMLDKSTSTNNELIIMNPTRCQNEEQHFKAFRKMFRHIPSDALRDIFENCCGDVNWAVEIVIDGMENKQFGILKQEELSEEEEDVDTGGQCECLAAYNIIPDSRALPAPKQNPVLETVTNENNAPTSSPKRIRKDATVSGVSMELKRQIEKNVVISDDHYSQHCLKIRNIRRGEPNDAEEKVETTTGNNETDSIQEEVQDNNDAILPSTSGKVLDENKTDTQSEGDEDEYHCMDEIEKTVNITIGKELLAQLDRLFGREDMKYPDNVVPRINAPVSFLNEMNALWMESLMHQLEDSSKQSEVMIQQDADFARELEKKEEEFLLAGKKSEVPDFQEIMDLDFALSLYQRDVDEWRNNEPLDMAAKMSRDKLFNLFPDVSSEILSEILMAHNNNFQDTVEALLLSTGKMDILQEKNGVRRFIMNREMESKQKYLQEKSKALSDVEWPLLPRNDNISIEDVNNYRAEATRQLVLRQKSYQKAKEYMQRGMLPAASFFSSAGAFHTRLFEQANSKAAVSLAEVNARCKDNATLDLHNYRVCESMESLDIFLDIHIQRLRQMNGRNGNRGHTLFFITGRGLHSTGGPKVKPACKRRLRERGLFFHELNPGLLAAKVSANNKLSDELA